MKNVLKRILPALALIFAVVIFTGCGNSSEDRSISQLSGRYDLSDKNSSNADAGTDADTDIGLDTEAGMDPDADKEAGGTGAAELTVCFGDQGNPFILHLYDNDTARAIARHVGTADWRLPIYHYDDYENWEVMQYYDIPSRYEIPSVPETISEETAGTVYYSEPNRIVLFYGDAQVSGEYTPVGYFDNTDEFRSAVENNPVLEGWGNKIVLISDGN